MATTTTRPAADAESATTTREGPIPAVREVADNVAGAAGEALDRLPGAAATTRGSIDEMRRSLTSGSDARLSAGTLLAFGFAMGLLVGGANRLLVLLALTPAAAMGTALLDRGSKLQGGR